jgi:hypothetical protein
MTDEEWIEAVRKAAKAGYWVGREDRYNWPDTPRTLEDEADIIAAAVLAPKVLEAAEHSK